MRDIVFPSDPRVRSVFGVGLDEDSLKAARAYRARLARAQHQGVLPERVYVSPRRFGWDKAELDAALAALPRSYAAFHAERAARGVNGR